MEARRYTEVACGLSSEDVGSRVVGPYVLPFSLIPGALQGARHT